MATAFLYICLIHIVYGALTPAEIDDLRTKVIFKINNFNDPLHPQGDKPLAARIIRLVFHDCSGPENTGDGVDTVNNDIRKCDGCININLDDHKGLQPFAMDPLESIYNEYASRISRADFYAAAGTIALELTASLSDQPGELPAIPFYFGRPDCPSAPNGYTTPGDLGTEFPLAHLGWDAMNDFMKNSFGFTIAETAVLMGAHTLGRMHPTISGYDGQWTNHPGHFDNQFFTELFNGNNEWDQVFGATTNGFPQFENLGRNPNDQKLTMLNSDYGMLVMMEEPASNPYLDPETGAIGCRVRGFGLYDMPQCRFEVSYNRIRDYAFDNQYFYDDFVKAWIKLLNNHQNDLIEVRANGFILNNHLDPFNIQPLPLVVSSAPTLEPTMTPSKSPTAPTLEPVSSLSLPPTYCCHANNVPNWNGRCWGFQDEITCNSIGGSGCYWDPNNCRATQVCLLRGQACVSRLECCSEFCRPDNSQCR